MREMNIVRSENKAADVIASVESSPRVAASRRGGGEGGRGSGMTV
jgi:hypothetical protein